MNKITLVLSLLGVSASSLLATTNYAFLDAQNTQTLHHFDGWDFSPYNGATGTNATENGTGNTPVQLFCDDFSDHVDWGSSWTVDLTNVTAANGTNTRFGTANNSTVTPDPYPTGTALYEQIAWLFTQETAPNQTLANDNQIQEAVWIMTGVTGAPPTGAGVANINKWISAAQSYYLSDSAHTPDAYEVADYSRWTVVTDTASVGHTIGSGNQEFLAYNPASGIPGTGFGKVPEPATFLLFGSGLLAVGLLGRRKSAKR